MMVVHPIRKESNAGLRAGLDSDYSVVAISQVIGQRFAHVFDLYTKSVQVVGNSVNI